MLSGGYFLEDESEPPPPPFDLMEAFRAALDWPMTPPVKEKQYYRKDTEHLYHAFVY